MFDISTGAERITGSSIGIPGRSIGIIGRSDIIGRSIGDISTKVSRSRPAIRSSLSSTLGPR